MVSRQSKSAIAVMVERKSCFVLLGKLLRKTSLNFSNAIHSRLIDYPRHPRRTITYDNGSENVDHGIINKCLSTKSYFCNPYCSWKKGSVENSIGLVRRYLPEKTDFAKLSCLELVRIEYF
jgi:IS30 family transposase